WYMAQMHRSRWRSRFRIACIATTATPFLFEVLKELVDVVGVTCEGTNDGPALKTAHTGFFAG
ncbi:hypothetical protein EDB89DRAFT_1995694, partial [Lactarius sanguifluus]